MYQTIIRGERGIQKQYDQLDLEVKNDLHLN